MSLVSEGGGIPAVMNVSHTSPAANGNCGGWGGDWGAWIILFLIFGMFGWGGMGGFGGFGGFGGMGGGYPVESILQRSLDTQTIIGKLDGVSNGLCDGFYAQSNAINGLGMNMMQGFSQAELSRCNQQAALMQQLYQMGYNQQDCCCRTQNAIERTNYDAAMRSSETNRLIDRGFCDTNYNAATNTTAIIQNAHNDTDRVLARLDAMEMSRKDETIFALRQELQNANLQASQANQNAAIGAMISASEATILRRTGVECPTPCYVVQPPQPVSFSTHCSGQANFNNGWGNNCGNSCGGC